MKFVHELSLEQIVLVKLATILWNQDDIKTLILKLYLRFVGDERNKYWQNVEDRVAEKVLQLKQPELLKGKILGLVKPIGLQIYYWVKYHRDPYFDITNLPSEFSWTPHGTIDRKKTAEILLQDGNLDIIKCYKLACNCCLKDHILELWHKIPGDYKKSIENNDLDFQSQFSEKELLFFMTYDAKQEVAKMKNFVEKRINHSTTSSPYMHAFCYSAYNGNKAAVEYFFQKQDIEERAENIILATHFITKRLKVIHCRHREFPKVYYIEVLLFLLRIMDEKQQVELIRDHAYKVLHSFLEWPFQSFFRKTAHHALNFLNPVSFECMLEVIVDKVKQGYKDWNYQELFREFWWQSSENHKKFCVSVCTSNSALLLDLFKIKDHENVRLILKYATADEKEEIICNYNGMNICENLIYCQNFDALIFFLRECILSKDVMKKFIKKLDEHIKNHHPPERKLKENRVLWRQFFKLLRDFRSSLR